MPSDGAASTARRRAATPMRWPSARGRPRAAAQRPLPSSKIATCSFEIGAIVKVLLLIKYQSKKICHADYKECASWLRRNSSVVLEVIQGSKRENQSGGWNC